MRETLTVAEAKHRCRTSLEGRSHHRSCIPISFLNNLTQAL